MNEMELVKDNAGKHTFGQHDWYGEPCARCLSLFKSRRQVTYGFGAIPNSIMFIGESPGQRGANLTGVPFTKDRSGSFFQQVLCRAGFIFENVYTTNICKCSPLNNRGLDEQEILNCLPYLKAEIKAVKPKLIVTLGRAAATLLLDRTSFSVVRDAGALAHSTVDWYDGDIIIMPHPAFILRNGDVAKKNYIKEFKYIFKLYMKEKVIDTTIIDTRWN